MRHIYRVQSLCKGQMYSTSASDLAYHLIQAIESLAHVVESLSSGHVNTGNNIDHTIIALARSCTSVFHGLRRLESLASSGSFPSHVVFACIGFFDDLFTSIEEVASIQARLERSNQPALLLPALSQLAASLITNLRSSTPTCAAYADILEGAAYHLLHRLGEAAHELLLDGPRQESIEDEIRRLPIPEDQRLDPVRQTAQRAMLISAPHLLKILRRAVENNTSTPFVGNARLRLQRTLVDSIFGQGTGGSVASGGVLELPKVTGAPPVAGADVRVENVQGRTDWFESELWALVGWDILGDEGNL